VIGALRRGPGVWGARRKAALAALLTAGALLFWAAPAGAHAAVVSSSPTQGQRLAHAPASVTIVWDQPVKPDNGGVTVLNSSDQSVGEGGATHPAPDTLRVALPLSLPSGAYVANYTVTSVDGHVVSGGIVFLVGNARPGSIASLTRPPTSAATWYDRGGQFITYLGVLTAGGLAFFLAFLLPEGSERRRLGRWCAGAVGLGVLGMLVTVAAQGDLAGGSLGALAHWTVLSQAAGGKLGAQFVLQLLGLAGCLMSLRLRLVTARQATAFYGMLLSAGAFVAFGHALVSPERWLSTPADVVHVVFAAMWLGGLIGLVQVLRSRVGAASHLGELTVPTDEAAPTTFAASVGAGGGGRSTAVLERTAPSIPTSRGELGGGSSVLAGTITLVKRFSTMAGFSISLVLAAGTLLAIAEVGSVANLFETGYGQTLLVKIALVGLLIVVAGYNRFLLVPWLSATEAGGSSAGLSAGWRRLLATVRLEAVIAVAILLVTALLANGVPSNGAAPPSPVPFARTVPFDGGHLSFRITPNQALVNNVSVQFTGSDGSPAEMAESVSLYLNLPAQDVGPIEVDTKKVGVGRFVLMNSPNPPIVGTWDITLQIQVSEFSQPDVSFVDKVQ
jgi:copper transport protein